jgi:glycosyltransferase involved in cell wall biosynthesis
MRLILIPIKTFYPGFHGGGPARSIYNLSLSFPNSCFRVLCENHERLHRKPYSSSQLQELLDVFPANLKASYCADLVYPLALLSNILHLPKAIRPILYLPSFFSSYSILSLFLSFFLSLLFKNAYSKLLIVISPRNELSFESLRFSPLRKRLWMFCFRILRCSHINSKLAFHSSNPEESSDIALHFPGSRVFLAPNIPPPVITAPSPSLPLVPLKLLYVGRISKDKNIAVLASVVALLSRSLPVTLTVVGPIVDSTVYHTLCSIIDSSSALLEYVGPVNPFSLRQYYLSNHAFFFPALSENFCNSIAESLSHGLPVVTSSHTPWSQSTSLASSGTHGLISNGFYASTSGDFSDYVTALSRLNDTVRSGHYSSVRAQALAFYLGHPIVTSSRSLNRLIFE